jgi:hypothetical protein
LREEEFDGSGALVVMDKRIGEACGKTANSLCLNKKFGREQNMVKKIIALGVLIIMAISLAACENTKGSFYSLQEAYDEGLLTVEDLQSIANYQSAGEDEPDFAPIPKNPEYLSNEIINAIKKTYLVNLRDIRNQDGTLMCPNATISDVKFLGYYGTYNNAIAIKISDEYSGYPGVVQKFTVADITFTYSGVPVVIWQA